MLNLIHKGPLIHQLEWKTLTEKLGAFCLFKDSTLNRILTPVSKDFLAEKFDGTKLFLELKTTDDFYALLTEIRGIPDLESSEKLIKRLEKSAILTLKELNTTISIVEVNLVFFRFLKDLKLTQDEDINDLKKVERDFIKPFRKFVSKDGTIDFMAHPELRRLYQAQLDVEEKIRNVLSYLQNDKDFALNLQFTGHDIINQHYVLAIKSDHFNSKIGSIVSRSDTGNTLFVEPYSIRDHNYKRMEIISEIQEKINKLATEFSHKACEIYSVICACHFKLQNFDDYQTRANFASLYNLSRPKISDHPEIKIYGLYHPLIEKPVKNDFILDSTKEGLVISGPNTGGKTATIKACAISILLMQHGLFVPASEATIFPYEGIFYFGNDQQNLEEGLSSFAAEIKNYTQLLDEVENNNVIFIDEIFNSTSSDEASALSISYLDKLHELARCHIVLSTHHQMLKTYIHERESYISCHVGFDEQSHRPTYKLHYGVPGSSMALEIFKLMTKDTSFEEDIYTKALKLLRTQHISYETLLQKVSHKQSELDQLLLKNREIKQQLENQKKAMEGVYQLKLDEKLKVAEKKLKQIGDKAEYLSREAKRGNITPKKIHENFHDLKSDLNRLAPPPKSSKIPVSNERKLPAEYFEGEKYFSSVLNCVVTLKKINSNKKDALIQKGNITSKAALTTLFLDPSTKNQAPLKDQDVGISFQRSSEAKIEYDMRGHRLEEFQAQVEAALADLYTLSIPYLIIIHGHGDGILKKWLRKFIKDHKDLTWEQGSHGNDGETRIFLSR